MERWIGGVKTERAAEWWAKELYALTGHKKELFYSYLLYELIEEIESDGYVLLGAEYGRAKSRILPLAAAAIDDNVEFPRDEI